MPRSKIARLPRELREEIERMWRDGAFTLDEMMEFLHRHHADAASDPEKGVSRSGLHRYFQRFGATAERMRLAQQYSEATVAKLAEGGDRNLLRMVTQILSTLYFDQASKIEGRLAEADTPMKPGDLMLLAKGVQSLVAASKASAEAELKIRKEIAAEMARKAAPALKQIDAAAKAGGLSPETAAAIRAAIGAAEV